MDINDDVEYVLIGESEISETVGMLAAKINARYAHIDGVKSKLLVLGLLKGAFVFMADLIRKLKIPLTVDFISASSYGAGTVSSGSVTINSFISKENDLSSYEILVVEDIVDSGKTLIELTDYLMNRGVKSVETCVLLDKISRRVVDFTPDYIGKVIDDVFIVGYGLDYDEKYRMLPYIGVLKPELYGIDAHASKKASEKADAALKS
jgi:hypoxanthine phosphoribosyltransferase